MEQKSLPGVWSDTQDRNQDVVNEAKTSYSGLLEEEKQTWEIIWAGPLKEAALVWGALKVEPEKGLGAGGVFSWRSLEAEEGTGRVRQGSRQP